MTITGYQTLQDKGDPGDIEEHGPYKCTRDDAWLGYGYYFWDRRIEWAHWWGKKSLNNSYLICTSKIVLDERCYDLVGNTEHQEDFLETLDILEDGWIDRDQDATVPEVIEYLKKKDLFDYDSIRAHHFPEEELEKVYFTARKREFMYFGQKVQICLIKVNQLALQTFKVVFPEDYVEN